MLCIAGILTLLVGQTAAAQTPGLPNSISAENAPIAYLVDLSSGQVLLSREADRRFVPASITKVMTAYVAFDLIEQDRILPAQVVTVPPAVAEEWSGTGSTMFLQAGDRVTIDQLLTGITSVSANDGAVMLATAALGNTRSWVDAMNKAADRLGMQDSHFGTANGWPDEGRTFTTARDLSKLARAVIARHPAFYAHYFGREGFSYNGIAQANHDPLVGRVEGADGLKTGYTNQAGYGFLGSVLRGGRRLVLVVAASPSHSQRDAAARALVEWGFGAFDPIRLHPRGAVLAQAQVQGGQQDTIDITAPKALRIALPKGTNSQSISQSIQYLGPLPAPIKKGQRVANLIVQLDGQPPYALPLVAASDVAEAGLFKRIVDGIKGLLS